MTNGELREKKRLDALFEALTEEIVSASDVDILAEADRIYGDPERIAARMRTRLVRELEENQDLAAAKRSWEAGGQPSQAVPSSKRSN